MSNSRSIETNMVSFKINEIYAIDAWPCMCVECVCIIIILYNYMGYLKTYKKVWDDLVINEL